MNEREREALREEAIRLLILSDPMGAGSLDRNVVAEHLYDLTSFRPEHAPEAVVADGGGDAPFFSEAYLYPLLGKGDARALLQRFEALQRTLGFAGWPSSMTIERAVIGPWTEIEDRDEEALQRGKRLGHLEEVDGEWRITERGLRRKAMSSETQVHDRRIWGIEIIRGPSAGTRIQVGDHLGALEDLMDIFRRSWTCYRLLLEPVEEGGEPEPLTPIPKED